MRMLVQKGVVSISGASLLAHHQTSHEIQTFEGRSREVKKINMTIWSVLHTSSAHILAEKMRFATHIIYYWTSFYDIFFYMTYMVCVYFMFIFYFNGPY